MNTAQLITRFRQEHYIRGNSPRTIDSYTKSCLAFFKFIRSTPLNTTERDIKSFIYHLKNRGKSASTCNRHIFALKSFFALFSKNSDTNPAKIIQRVKTSKQLPSVLSTEEVGSLISNCVNFKHRAILTVTYSGGLRLAEVHQLKLADIDSQRMVIKVTGKGNKQRLLPLHESTLDFLRTYYRIYKPLTWLFEGSKIGQPLNRASYQKLIKRYANLAGINKHVSMHTLRHSYATHLLENGVSIKVIQELLGHNSIQSTQIYTHVTSKMMSKVFSPVTLLDLSNFQVKKGEDNEQ